LIPSKKTAIFTVNSNKSFDAKNENMRVRKKMAKSVLEKSKPSSGSISPANMHNSYYKKINTHMQNYVKTNMKSPYLNKRQRNIKNMTQPAPSNGSKNNYDSFLEYLNDNVKTTINFEVKKKSYTAKHEKINLKSSIEAVKGDIFTAGTMPSNKRSKPPKMPKSNNLSIASKNGSFSKPKLDISQTLSMSSLNKFKPEYGMVCYQKQYPKTTKNRAPSIKSKNRTDSTQRTNKNKSKSKIRLEEQLSLERSIETLSSRKNSVMGLQSSRVNTDSSHLLCRKIKEDIKQLESSKLSKYLKSCKQKLNSTKAKYPKVTSTFAMRGGSFDIQLLSKSNTKLSQKKIRSRKADKYPREVSKNSNNKSHERNHIVQKYVSFIYLYRPITQRLGTLKSCILINENVTNNHYYNATNQNQNENYFPVNSDLNMAKFRNPPRTPSNNLGV
jgi:predicted DNA binding CopG/RHH family protein